MTASGEKDAQGANKVIKIVRKKVHVLADVTAMIFWLKNRMPKEWRDTYRMQHVFNPEAGLEGITPEDEIEVERAVEEILHGCPVCHPRQNTQKREVSKCHLPLKD